jgi:hypothetical protein
MRIPFCLIIFFFICPTVNAQQITKAEAIAFAEKLHQKKILNEAGKHRMIQAIDGSNIHLSIEEYGKGITKQSILGFCASAFQIEMLYRIGYREQSEKKIQQQRKKKYEKAAQEFKNNPQAYEKWIVEQSDQQAKHFKASRIEKKIPEEDRQLNYSWVSPLFGVQTGIKPVIDKTRSVFGKTRSRTAKDLYEIGLIDDRVYNDIKLQLADSTIADESQVCMVASEKTHYYEEYPSQRKQLLQLIDSLSISDVMSPEKAASLKSRLKEYELYDFDELAANCKRTLIIRKHPDQTLTGHYRRVFDTLQTILPDFRFTDLKISLDSTQGLFGPAVDFELMFNASARTYGSSLEINYLPDSLSSDFSELMSDAEFQFHSGINKWLCDQNSPYRLYLVYSSGRDIVLMLLTKQQALLWQRQEHMSYITLEDHTTVFNSAAIEKAIADFERIGLFRHLPQSQIDSGISKVQRRTIRSHTDILTSFRNVTLSFDWEASNLENPYEELTLKMATISWGEFTPTNVTDDFDENSFKPNAVIHYSFDFRGKHYSADLSGNDDWLAPQFFELIQTALKENHLNGHYYQCIDNGQEAGYIYLTQKQHDYLIKNYKELIVEE